MKIALDAMGGDFGPPYLVAGAVMALREYRYIKKLFLVGDTPQIELELKKHRCNDRRIDVVHSTQVVDMSDRAWSAVRRKKDSSVSRAVDLVKHGQADAIVTAGHTGAAVAASNVNQPKGNLDGPRQDFMLATNDQLGKADSFRPLIIAYKNGAPVYLSDVADVVDGAENNYPSYDTGQHYRYAKYYSLTGHLMIPEILVFSKRTWATLQKGDQAAARPFFERAAASGRRAHHRCSVLGCPCRIDFSRAHRRPGAAPRDRAPLSARAAR